MKPGVIYRGYFENAQLLSMNNGNGEDGQQVIISIEDMETLIDDAATETIYDLSVNNQLTDKPLAASVIDNSEDKHTVVRSKQVEINIFSGNGIDLSTFSTGGDLRWRVKIAVNDLNNIHFIGYLSTADISMDFVPDPALITLIATDNLGLLGEVPLTGFSGERVTGEQKLSTLIAMALHKTGLDLEIIAIHNVREENHPDDHLFDSIYQDVKTYERTTTEKEDCYTVLEKILGEYCFITQWKGRWYIMSEDEISDPTVYPARFDSEGNFIEFLSGDTFQKGILENEDLQWQGLPDPPPLVTLTRPLAALMHNFRYEFPLEIIDNIDFSRGTDDIIPIVVDMGWHIHRYANLGAFPSTGDKDIVYYAIDTGNYYKFIGLSYEQVSGTEIPSGIAYVWEDWTLERVGGGVVNSTSYIAKIFQSGTEIDRYGVIGASANAHRVISNPVKVGKYDKFTVSVDRRLSDNLTGPGQQTDFVFQLILEGNDGSTWNVDDTGAWSLIDKFIEIQYNRDDTDEEEWANVSVETRPIPVSGKLRIALYQSQFTSAVQTQFANLRFEYIAFINGSYQRYPGHQHKISQALNTKVVREKDVFIDNAPRPSMKGAMLVADGVDFVPAGRFFNWAHVPTPTEDHYHPYGYTRAQAAWNQYNRQMVMFDGTVIGLQSGETDGEGLPNSPDLLHRYVFGDVDNTTINRFFQLLHYEMDYNLCTWRGFFYEVYNTAIGKKYDDTYEYKYLSE